MYIKQWEQKGKCHDEMCERQKRIDVRRAAELRKWRRDNNDRDAQVCSVCTLSKKYCTVVQIFRDKTRNVEKNEIIHEIFRVISRFHHYILHYISENILLLGQCRLNGRLGTLGQIYNLILSHSQCMFQAVKPEACPQ